MGFLDKIKKQLAGSKEEENKVVDETPQTQPKTVKEEQIKEEAPKDNFWSSLFTEEKQATDASKVAEDTLAKQKEEAEAEAEAEKAKKAQEIANEKLEAERIAKEKAEAQKRAEQEALKAKEAEKLRLENEAKANAEKQRLEQEAAEKLRLEKENLAKAEAEKLAKEKAEQEAAALNAKAAESEKNTGFWGNFFGRGNKSSDEELEKDLNEGMQQTKQGFFEKITKAVAGKTEVDDDLLDEIEDALVSSDVGVETTVKIIERLEEKVSNEKYFSTKELYRLVKDVIIGLLSENKTPNLVDYEFPDKGKYPYVVLVVGVNGVGKTTTIAKLAAKAKAQGKKVVLGAGDTFRAAAVKQIEVWGERIGVSVISHGMDTDPAAVAFDTVKIAMEQNADVVFIDTAGRLHNKVGLMNELSKIKRVMQKIVPDVPHDVLLVLDASTGQNALEQAKHFTEATQVSCIAVTKLDGTAKGGVILGIADQFSIPIRYIGVGEQVHHLQLFNKEKFVDTLFGE